MSSPEAAPARAVLPVRLPPPLDALEALRGARHPFLRLADPLGHRGAAWSYLAVDPVDVLRVGALAGEGALAAALAPLAQPGRRRPRGAPPFAGGWAGFIGYEARAGVELCPAPRAAPLGFPAVWLGRYDALLAWDHARGRTLAVASGRDPRDAARRARELARRARGARGRRPVGPAATPRARTGRARYEALVRAAREAVREGEIFQANLSQRFQARYDGDPIALFRRLATSQPAPYATFVDAGDGRAVLSASPERFLRVSGRRVETDPMKGTRPRGATPAEDRRLRRELAGSEKERAELAMIVDLSRNDLARTCAPGTVRVRVRRRLLAFPRVHQAIAVVEGRLRDGLGRVDALAAAFPPGSVTGAPKVRAMEVIDALEGEGRGPYCGALGWFDEGGDMDLAVAIRTLVVRGTTVAYRVGGGITLRSDPAAEWVETLTKGRGLFAAVAGREQAP